MRALRSKFGMLHLMGILALMSVGGCDDSDDDLRRDGGASDTRYADVKVDTSRTDTSPKPDTSPDMQIMYDTRMDTQMGPDGGQVDSTTQNDGSMQTDSMKPDEGGSDAKGSDALTNDGGMSTDSTLSSDTSPSMVDAMTVDANGALDGMGDLPSNSDGNSASIAYMAMLGGDQETPMVASDATGSASLTLDLASSTLTYQISHTVTNAKNAHIHLANAGESGPVVFPLSPVGADMAGAILLTQTQIADLEAGRYYINIHSDKYSDGEIRGQILQPGELLYVAMLTGEQEVPSISTSGKGTASVIVNAAQNSIKYHLTTSSLTPVSAHIHTAMGGMIGPVTIPFVELNDRVFEGTATLTAEQAADLSAGHMYVNVHTTEHPGGEIRGQLLLPGERLATSNLLGANEVPPVAITATGAAAFVLNYKQDRLRYEAVFNDLSSKATAVEIVDGRSGENGPVRYALTLTQEGMAVMGTLNITKMDVEELQRTPSRLYMNVHTAINPSGEIRGQIVYH